MPIDCAIRIECLGTETFGELDYRVMRCAFDSQNALSRLADEGIFQADMLCRLNAAGTEAEREVAVTLSFGSFCKTLFLDFVVSSKAVYEFKVVSAINAAHVGQLLTYLYLLDLRHGKLINFGSSRVESKFVNAPLTLAERRNFSISDSEYYGEMKFQSLVTELLRDWGTSLTLSLYEEALIELLGGQGNVVALLPITRNGILLGNQRFHLANAETAFRLTALNPLAETYKTQLKTLLSHSPLESIHWVNIGHHELAFTTIQRS